MAMPAPEAAPTTPCTEGKGLVLSWQLRVGKEGLVSRARCSRYLAFFRPRAQMPACAAIMHTGRQPRQASDAQPEHQPS